MASTHLREEEAMNRHRILVLSLLTLLGVGAAAAYTLLSPRQTWNSPPRFIVDSRGHTSITDADHGVTRTVNAILTWNGAGAGMVVDAVKGSVASWQLGDGVPMINFRDPVGACAGSCLAATLRGYIQRADGTYRIADADIVTNPNAPFTSAGEPDGCAGEFYIEAVMVREVGHALGLGNSSVPGATMNPSTIAPCSNAAATIEADDKAALLDLY
jgi:hypothetical protein